MCYEYLSNSLIVPLKWASKHQECVIQELALFSNALNHVFECFGFQMGVLNGDDCDVQVR